MDISFIVLAFVEGLGLILSPCILPLLPILLSASVSGSKRRPYGIILGFVLSFAIFTYFSRQIVISFGIDIMLLRNISLVLLLILGLMMISTYLTDKFTNWTQNIANLGFKLTNTNDTRDFNSGVLFGALVGLIWTPCAGPIFAAVIVQSISQSTSLNGFLTILAFAIGAGAPMLLIAIFGQRLMSKVSFFTNHTIMIRKILGTIIILAVLFMYYGTSFYANANPNNKVISSNNTTPVALIDGITPYPAPDFTNIAAWINSPPLTMQQLRGKVVLIDFWAYSCINCIRTLPYIKQWYKDYHDKGLVIVGVHSPEFDFERDLANVEKAVKQDGIEYPVALDNDFATWKKYDNHYWPAHYLIDQNGNVVYTHFGEGNYLETENNIRFLLDLTAKQSSSENDSKLFNRITPETYCGYQRANNYAGTQSLVADTATFYKYPSSLDNDKWALNGQWLVGAEKILNTTAQAGIKLQFRAKHVYAVLGTSNSKTVKVKIFYNGAPLIQHAGKDVIQGVLEVKGHTLYTLLDLDQYNNGTLELVAEEPGLELYTFTFGD